VSDDIHAKAQDCGDFGMGRLITTDFQTVQNGKVVNGWEVLYQWISTSGFETERLRVPKLTSPASVSPPPGVYSIQAQKLSGGRQIVTSPIRITLSGIARVACDIQVP
jgi:hypothetical protein